MAEGKQRGILCLHLFRGQVLVENLAPQDQEAADLSPSMRLNEGYER